MGERAVPGIRIAGEQDADAIGSIYAPVVVHTATSFEFDVPPPAEIRRRLTQTLETHPWLVCDDGDEIAGYAYATSHRTRAAYQWCAEVSVYVREGRQHQGTGRALYGKLFELLAAQGFCNAYAGITLPNPVSVAFHEAAGFAPVGLYSSIGHKFGRWHDVAWYVRRLRELTGDPVPPVPFSAFRSTQACTDILGSTP